PGDGLGQAGIHLAELIPQGNADRLELAAVIGDGDGEQDEKETGGQQQLPVEPSNQNHRSEGAHDRVDNQAQAGAKHQVEGADIVGSAGHNVADALAAVKGLALTQQVSVQFVAGIALNALGQELAQVVAGQAGQPLTKSHAHHS